jgi:hypothetical protein
MGKISLEILNEREGIGFKMRYIIEGTLRKFGLECIVSASGTKYPLFSIT